MRYHDAEFAAGLHADRRATAVRRRPPLDGGELADVVRAAAAGDASAWSALTERFAARIRTVARRHRLAAHDVEDVVQTTWLQLLRHIGQVRDPLALGGWLETTARHESLRIIRGAQRERPSEAEIEPGDPAPPVDEQRLAAAERAAAVAAALTQLPHPQRRLMGMLVAEPAAPYADISRALDMPIGSIGPTRARALDRLRRDRGLIDVVGAHRD